MDFTRLTVRCLEALAIAQALAVRSGHAVVQEPHLVLALCKQEQGILSLIFDEAGKDVSLIAWVLERQLEAIESTPVIETRIGAGVEMIFDNAAMVAESHSSNAVSTAHVLMVCSASESLCGELLRSNAVTRTRLCAADAVESSSTHPPENLPLTLKRYGRDLCPRFRISRK